MLPRVMKLNPSRGMARTSPFPDGTPAALIIQGRHSGSFSFFLQLSGVYRPRAGKRGWLQEALR